MTGLLIALAVFAVLVYLWGFCLCRMAARGEPRELDSPNDWPVP